MNWLERLDFYTKVIAWAVIVCALLYFPLCGWYHYRHPHVPSYNRQAFGSQTEEDEFYRLYRKHGGKENGQRNHEEVLQ